MRFKYPPKRRLSLLKKGNSPSPEGFVRVSPQFDEFALALKLRRCAFIAIAVATLTTVSAVLVVPMLYNYIHLIQHQIQVVERTKKQLN